jgi:hypothetical protein
MDLEDCIICFSSTTFRVSLQVFFHQLFFFIIQLPLARTFHLYVPFFIINIFHVLYMWHPCRHSKVCKQCASELMLCPTCFTMISGVRDPIIVSHMKPKILENAFNSTITPDVELPTRKQKTPPSKRVNNMVVLGGKEADLLFESKEDSIDNNLDILNSTFDLTSPRVTRLLVGGRSVKATAPNLHVSNLIEKLPT